MTQFTSLAAAFSTAESTSLQFTAELALELLPWNVILEV
jgi:hypothetical protein